MDEVFVKRVFDVRAAIRAVEEPGAIGFVFREEQVGIAGAEQPALAILPVLQFDASGAGKAGGPSRDRAAEIFSPRPGIAKPELWQDMERGGCRAARFPQPIVRREIRLADTCTACACSCAWESNRDRNSTPSHPRRDCPDSRSGQTGVPCGWDRARSRAR